MHIILAFLGAVVTILVLLNKLQQNGLDVGWLNPFTWHRRRKYRLNHDVNPVFKLDSPIEVVSLYMVAIAKVDGDMSKEQKAAILTLFEDQLHLSQSEAKAQLGSSVHLFGRGDEVLANPHRVIERTINDFSPDQLKSVVELMDKVAEVEGQPTSQQTALIDKIKNALPKAPQGTW